MLLEQVILRDDRASQPAANTVPVGTLYYVTDETIIERSNGATWDSYSGAGSGITELTGDVTAGPGSGSVAATIPNGTVTYAKMQDVSATSRILARVSGGAGDVEEATLTQVLDMVGSAAHGDVLYRDSAAWARLPAGTSGQFLQTAGAGADPIWADGGSGDIATARLDVTDAQIRSLNTSPLTIVAAPGANKIVVPVKVMAKGIRSGTAFSADPSMRIRWAGIATDLMATWTYIFNSAVAGTLYRMAIGVAYNGSTSDDPTNKALTLTSSADVTLGAGCSMSIVVQYYIADFS